jgi:hypothetical protein
VPEDKLNVSICPKADGADIKTITAKKATGVLLMNARFNGSIFEY